MAASQTLVKSMGKNEKLAEQKKKIRREALAKRDSLTPAQRTDCSGRIMDTLTKLSCYMEAEAVLTYVGFRSEVDTIPLIKQALADRKAVFVPRVSRLDMEFYQIFSVEELAEGYRGIYEPTCGIPYTDWISQKNLPRTLLCLPGAAFDRACHRIGYGGGFYDRYLSRFAMDEAAGETEHDVRLQAEVTTAALAFSSQIFEEIPWEAHDICPMCIITEEGILWKI